MSKYAEITDNTSYCKWHEKRFIKTLSLLKEELAEGARIADVGSHRLYFDAMLIDNGYSVVGFDAPEVVRHDVTQRNAHICGMELFEIEDLTRPNRMPKLENCFDCLILLEVVEHLAFNPLSFWEWAISLIKPGGKIIITTPNSMRLDRRISDLKHIVLGKGTGIRVNEIFNTITRGHHWKEFSGPEMLLYFERIGCDQQSISVKYMEYKELGYKRRPLYKMFPDLGSEMFITVKVPNDKIQVPEEPRYLSV